jgi:hypothetical protein
MVVVAIGVGWWNDQHRIASEADRLQRATIAYRSKLDSVIAERREELERGKQAVNNLPEYERNP